MAQLRTTRNATPVETSARRHTIASYTDYQDAERAVDWLSDQRFAVERGAIIGTGLRSVEQVTGRMTVWRAALVGAGEGALIGALIALLFGLFSSGPDFGELLLFSLAVGAFFGGSTGAIIQAASGEGRNFASTMTVATDSYEVQVDEDAAAEATRILDARPAGDGARA
jgi:Heat induced stress protein YflT domain